MNEQAEMQTNEEESGRVERLIIRQILESEIKSLCKSALRYAENEQLQKASYEDARREGVSWSLFILAQKCGV